MLPCSHCGGSEPPISVGPLGYPRVARYIRHANGDRAPPKDEQRSKYCGGHRPIIANGITIIANVAIEFAIA